jgi:hypothetical protein
VFTGMIVLKIRTNGQILLTQEEVSGSIKYLEILG